MENTNGDTYVSESQIIAEEVLFELGQSGSANPHRRSLPWLHSNTLIAIETAASSDSTGKHSQERRTALNAKQCAGWAGWSSHPTPTGHTLQKKTHCVKYTCICCLACCHHHKTLQQSLNSKLKAMWVFTISGFSSHVLLFGRMEVLPLLRGSLI